MPYSQSFKKQILVQCRDGASVSGVAKEHNVPRSTIYRWIKEEDFVETGEKVYSAKDIKALERRVAKLEKINAILKTVPCTVHAPMRERLDALEQRCHLLQVRESLVLHLCHPGSVFPNGDWLAHW